MKLHRWNQIEKEQMNPFFARRVIHADALTIARVYLKKGCLVPEHSHVNEQVSIIDQGVLRFRIGGREIDVRAGEALQIPPNVPHSAEALEDTEGIDVFTPVREDWARGDDAYLRR
jgi:quercetin dioxygenase-like cupin family protein